MASAELDELNSLYNDEQNRRLWAATLRASKGDKWEAIRKTQRRAERSRLAADPRSLPGARRGQANDNGP